MTLTPTRLCALSLFALTLLAAPARAENIPWSFSWSGSPSAIPDDTKLGSINVLPGQGNEVNSVQNILAAQLQAVGSSAASYTNAPYSLTMTITDGNSNTSNSMTFSGALSGNYNSAGGIHNTFLGPITQQLTLGGNIYSVTIGSFTGPLAPGSGTNGHIGADVIVTVGPGGGAQTAPEPGTLALAALGVGSLAARRWWKRRRPEQPS
jgi:MYXO-CTERM domain-containing protein